MAHMNKNTLTTGKGWLVLDKLVPEAIIDLFNDKLGTLYPIRALSQNKQYAEKQEISNLPDIAIWWSKLVDDLPEFKSIRQLIDPVVESALANVKHYASDVVTLNPGSTVINPHVDTPNRFKKWSMAQSMLGVQMIVALCDITPENGSTGVCSYSQLQDFDIESCYAGKHDKWFAENNIQPILTKGSVLMYNTKLLHSSMPNITTQPRHALLLNYIDADIIDELKLIDNIWSSNG